MPTRSHDLDLPRSADAGQDRGQAAERGSVSSALTRYSQRPGFLAMSGQIIDASIVVAPRERNTDGEKREIKEGLHSRGIGA